MTPEIAALILRSLAAVVWIAVLVRRLRGDTLPPLASVLSSGSLCAVLVIVVLGGLVPYGWPADVQKLLVTATAFAVFVAGLGVLTTQAET